MKLYLRTLSKRVHLHKLFYSGIEDYNISQDFILSGAMQRYVTIEWRASIRRRMEHVRR